MASCQGQKFIPQSTPHAFPLTNPHHSPCLPDIQPFSLNTPSWYQSISSMAYPLNDYQHALLYRLSWRSYPSPHGRTTVGHLHQPFLTSHNSLVCAFGTLSILLISSNPLRHSSFKSLVFTRDGVGGLLFLFYMNASRMRSWSWLSSQPLTIPAP